MRMDRDGIRMGIWGYAETVCNFHAVGYRFGGVSDRMPNSDKVIRYPDEICLPLQRVEGAGVGMQFVPLVTKNNVYGYG